MSSVMVDIEIKSLILNIQELPAICIKFVYFMRKKWNAFRIKINLLNFKFFKFQNNPDVNISYRNFYIIDREFVTFFKLRV